MSKLAHSNEATMTEIERNARKAEENGTDGPRGDIPGVHTPGPYAVWGDDTREGNIPFIEIGRGEIGTPDCKPICEVCCTITDDEDITKAFVITDENRATAAFIVRALNCHAELLGALKEIAKGEGPFFRDQLKHAESTIDSMKEIARAAIERAKQ